MKLEFALADESVAWHHDADFVPLLLDCFWKSARDVGESPGLCKRVNLAGYEKNVDRFRHCFQAEKGANPIENTQYLLQQQRKKSVEVHPENLGRINRARSDYARRWMRIVDFSVTTTVRCGAQAHNEEFTQAVERNADRCGAVL